MRALLRHIGRGEIDRNPFGRKAEAYGCESGANPLAAFADGFIGQADNGEGWQPRRNQHLHIDSLRIDALKRNCGHLREHPATPWSFAEWG
jgi:hypothetical protein